MQLALSLDTDPRGRARPGWCDDDRFWSFHVTHPEVYEALCQLARNLVERGHRHLGLKMLWETLRYQSMIGAAPGEEPWRLNNCYTSLYARLIDAYEPDLTGRFEMRARVVERAA